jgi:type IV secretory pathway VirB2 component (pilin)
MVEGLWGHALFLASKLDKRTHASVMTRFANSLPPQDPLQTLYQLHSGRIPASVTVSLIINKINFSLSEDSFMFSEIS